MRVRLACPYCSGTIILPRGDLYEPPWTSRCPHCGAALTFTPRITCDVRPATAVESLTVERTIAASVEIVLRTAHSERQRRYAHLRSHDRLLQQEERAVIAANHRTTEIETAIASLTGGRA